MKFKALTASFLACAALTGCNDKPAAPAVDTRPVAVLATGTNGGTDVQGDTEKLIDRISAAGYRVVVVPPRNVDASFTADHRNLLPRYAAVMAAANSRHVETIMPTTWASDGFHIGRPDVQAIGKRFAGAPTFGDSNSVFINSVTKGHCIGVSGMLTHDMLATQFPPAPTQPATPPLACRKLGDLVK